MTVARFDVEALAARALHLMGDGAFAEFTRVFHAKAVNHEAVAEPPASRERGPAGFYASALWLRDAFGGVHWKINNVLTDGHLVAVNATMSGRHTGTFITFDEEGRPAQAYPATGRPFTTKQTHWLRVIDEKVVEHWANRDDVGLAMQLGWIPPSPRYMFRMARALRKARRGYVPLLAGS
ncbi:ester cyclase [Actinocrispum wychmicini]|uniref:Putative ester cyclase n=1 Tax=Actinocrispum wychmicini TaxID=1213861 RepID=A0A4V2S6U7_9PSEU|nr:ester cyclase [Actinocrispum wychmicini]TCO57390.1 putative ester cyclase [Actinocrispum wychmicini]